MGPLPKDDEYNQFCSMTCCAGADLQISLMKSDQTEEKFAHIFFHDWYCENRMLYEIIMDRDSLFTSAF